MATALGACLLISLCGACGGSAEDPVRSGGSSSGGGEAVGGAASGGETSSGGETASGGSEASGGASSSGGSSSSGGESSTGGNGSDCPLMPPSRALPVVAVFFSGPDPGPCSSTTDEVRVSEYFYEDGLPMGSTGADTWVYERDGEGRIISLDNGFSIDTFQWGDGEVIQTGDYQVVRFQLDDRGYPRSAQVTPSDPVGLGGEYVYEWVDCRLERLLRPDGTVRTYHYDDVGHVILVDHGTYQYEYEYGCW